MSNAQKDFTNDTIIHVKNPNGFEYIQFRKLLEFKDTVTHAFTTRKGGVSKEPFNFLNMGIETTIIEERMKNYQIVSDELGFDVGSIICTKQVHGDIIRKVDKSHKGEGLTKELTVTEYDGIITNEQRLPIRTFAADCNMLLYFDPVNKVVAAVHSGWKSTVLDIAGKAIQKMKKEYHSNPQDIIVAIGPSARECCFEFGLEGLEIFKKKYIIRKEDKLHIDLVGIIIEQLEEQGVKRENILDSKLCTICLKDYFYSYRCAEAGNTGRHAGFIELL